MPNIAVVLKAEISRIAKKELKTEMAALRKAVTGHRSEIAALKRQLADQAKKLRLVEKSGRKAGPAKGSEPSSDKQLRFSAKRLAAQRQKLGLSAREFGLLIGATGQSVYKWETGATRPSQSSLEAIARLRGVGKREVRERLSHA